MESWLIRRADYLLGQSWQIAVLTIAVALACFFLRNRSAHVRYLLWLIVLAKCLVPPLYSIPVAILPPQEPPVYAPAPPLAERMVAEYRVREAAVTEPTGPASVPSDGASTPRVLKRPARYDGRMWLALGWLAGAVTLSFYYLVNALRTQIWLRRRRQALPRECGGSIRSFFAAHGVRRRPRVFLLDGISQPFVWGLVQGSIYLPAELLTGKHAKFQASLLGHELSHVLRFDAMINSLQVLAQTVFWFHPFVWWANRKIRAEREKCCDEMTIARWNTRPEEYSEAIVETLAAKYKQARPVPSLAVAGQVKNIEERIDTMLRPGKRFHKRPSFVAVTVALLITLVTIPTAVVLTARAETPQTTIQSADKPAPSLSQPAADSEKLEQPRYPARTFNSELALRISARETSEGSMSHIGDTPSAVPLQIPACWVWQVYPRAPVKDWSLLAREMSLNKIPGLVLDSCTDSDLKYLADMKDLRWLVLFRTSITDAGLEHLKGLTELEMLSLGQTPITDAGLAHLKGLTKLRQLYLPLTRITDAGLAHLKGLTELRDLYLAGTRITDAGLEHLQSLKGLKGLWVMNTGVTGAGLEHLKELTGLQYLGLTPTQAAGGAFVHLKGLTELEDLSIEGGLITDADLACLDGLPRLKKLGLSGTQITDVGLTHVRSLTGLTRLTLSRTRITDAGLEHLRGLAELHTLELEGTQITGTGLEHLRGLSGLQWLWLDNTRVGDAGLEHLKGLPGLQQLSLQNTPITDAGLEHLRGLKGLRRLWLDNTQIGDTGLGQLKGLTELTMLELPGTQVTDAGLEHLKGLTKLEGLYLGQTRITDAGLKHLQGLTNLRDLGLTKTQVTDAAVQQLKQSLPTATIWKDQPQVTTQGVDKPVQPITAGATPIFADNFDNGLSKQWRFMDLKTQALPAPGHAVENGQLRLSHAKAILDGINLTDCVARARFCIKEVVPGTPGHFHIETRVTPSLSGVKQRDCYSLILICDDSLLLLQFTYWDAPRTQLYDRLRFEQCKVVKNQWYTLELEVRGQQLRGYLDGKLLLEATDERLTKGSVQIGSWNATVLVDDFSVYPLP